MKEWAVNSGMYLAMTAFGHERSYLKTGTPSLWTGLPLFYGSGLSREIRLEPSDAHTVSLSTLHRAHHYQGP
jgi:hypothetical protein